MSASLWRKRRLLGNIFIISSFVILVFIYFPLISFYLPSTSTPRSSGDFYIQIAKIDASAPVITNVDPWNEGEYDKALQKGVAQAKGTHLPGEKGLIYLFAHSSQPPWKMTRQNTAFLRLGELNKGDWITINMYGKEYDYQVTDKKEVWPDQIQYLTQTDNNELILQTCTPIGTSLKRLLIFAEPLQII